MTAPRTQLRIAALASLAAAAALDSDPDFAPLVGAQVVLGQTWPTQSPAPGGGSLPNQILIYGWEEKSTSISGKGTAPQFSSSVTLVIETRVEVNTTAKGASAELPAQPTADAIAAAIDGKVDALAFAVKKAVCQYLKIFAVNAETELAFLENISDITSANKYNDDGQRVLGQGVVSFDLDFTETFEPLITQALDTVNVLLDPTVGAVANEGNTGNGTIAGVTVGLGAIAGAYAIRFTSATAFTVSDPNSRPVGAGAVGSAFAAGGIGFTISAGSAAFIAGDGFTLTVQAEGSYQLSP